MTWRFCGTSAKSTVLRISRDPKQNTGQYLASARKAAEDTPSAYLACLPGGRANLGIWAAMPSKGVAGTIAPRWTLVGAPKPWTAEDVQTWLCKHTASRVPNESRVMPQSRPKSSATAAPVWRARPLKKKKTQNRQARHGQNPEATTKLKSPLRR